MLAGSGLRQPRVPALQRPQRDAERRKAIPLEADVRLAATVDEAVAKTGLAAFLARGATLAVPVCAKIELEIAALEAADAKAFLADLGLHEDG